MAEIQQVPDDFSAHEASSSSLTMSIKQNNASVDLDLADLHSSLKPIALFLKNSVLRLAISAHADVPLSVMTQAYATSAYDTESDSVKFMLSSTKTMKVVTKTQFLRMFDLPIVTPVEGQEVNTDEVPKQTLLEMAEMMKHNPPLSKISLFNKSKVDCHWHLLFSILLRCLAERITGSENPNRQMLGICYALIEGGGYDIGTGVWKQFILGLSHTKRSSEISMARFWSVILEKVMKAAKVEIPGTVDFAPLPTLQIKKLKTSKSDIFLYGPKMTKLMEKALPSDHEVTIAYFKQFEKKRLKRTAESDLVKSSGAKKPRQREVPLIIYEPDQSSPRKPKGVLKKLTSTTGGEKPKEKPKKKKMAAKPLKNLPVVDSESSYSPFVQGTEDDDSDTIIETFS